MSNEGGGLLERHIEKNRIAYPIASISGGATDDIYGVKGFPSGALLDTEGRVIWMGHPGNISKGTIEEALADSLYLAPLEGKDYKKINKSMAKLEYGAALKEINKALGKAPDNSDLAGSKESIEALLKDRLEKASAAAEGGDFGAALASYESLAKMFKGTDAEKQVKELAKALGKNPDAKDELAAWKKMAKGDDAQRAGEFEKAAKAYEGVLKKYPDAKCVERAKAFLSRHNF